jgi:hypothetical protein
LYDSACGIADCCRVTSIFELAFNKFCKWKWDKCHVIFFIEPEWQTLSMLPALSYDWIHELYVRPILLEEEQWDAGAHTARVLFTDFWYRKHCMLFFNYLRKFSDIAE